jgi:glycosyltransferase involved in cell wall biosynthesis
MKWVKMADNRLMKVAVIIPCLNESAAIAKVVRDCKAHLPSADIYVLDNASDDDTASEAAHAGARVIYSPQRGKGNVLRHAFRVIDADYFVMIDGDGTYPVNEAPRLIELANEYNYEMVMGSRLKLGKPEAFRPLHYLGNRMLTGLVRLLFGFPVQDLLSGYRVFSRRFASEAHLISQGFEIETELTIRAMAQNLAFCEVPIQYGERVEGGKSKLRTFRDGWRILLTIIRFLAYFRPLLFFSAIGALTAGAGYFTAPPLQTPFLIGAPLFFTLAFSLDFVLHHKFFQRREINSAHVADMPRRKSA